MAYWAARVPSLVAGLIQGNCVRAYWYRDVPNFGDMLTPAILKGLGMTPVYTEPGSAALAGTGSILEHLPPGFEGQILGSGLLHAESSLEFPKAEVLAVRGHLTRARVSAGRLRSFVGDPGILACDLIPGAIEKRYALGIVPHYCERGAEPFGRLAQQMSDSALVVDARRDPLLVIKDIAGCELIVSSSLHGLIVADSLGIPHCWVHSGRLLGGRFKFDDYYSAFGVERKPIKIEGHESLQDLRRWASVSPMKAMDSAKEVQRALWREVGR